MITVKNINGTSQSSEKCNCGSWLNHWMIIGRYKKPDYCAIVGCVNPPTEGAHVQKTGTNDQSWYIIPVCHHHNMQKNQELSIPNEKWLVSANQSSTCNK